MPLAIRPTSPRYVTCQVINDNGVCLGRALMATAPGGADIIFGMEMALGPSQPYSIITYRNAFLASSTKGLPQGWMLVYSK